MNEKLPADLPLDWFNQICAELGLFDGARPVSPSEVLWAEVLPAIRALKADNPAAAIFINELRHTQELWRDALKRFADTNHELQRLKRTP
jgi:hypothetical protein